MMANALTVASKEFSDIVKGKRFIALLTIFALVIAVALASVYLNVIQTSGRAMPRGFLGLAASTLVTTMSYFAPIMGIALGFDTISGEREKGTLKTVLAQPVYRDTVINGKFLGALLSVTLAIFTASLINIGGSIIALGITPTGADIIRIIIFILFTILFTMTFYGIAAFLSTATKRTTQSIIISVVLWATFTFIIPIIASLIASAIIPINFQFARNITRPPGGNITAINPEMQQLQQQMREQASIISAIESLTPNYHFTRIAQYILGVYTGISGTRIGEGLGREQVDVASTPIMQSLISAWPNILVLGVIMTITFIASYILFTRQEIR